MRHFLFVEKEEEVEEDKAEMVIVDCKEAFGTFELLVDTGKTNETRVLD
jgi:hypothetical protein